MTQRKPGNVSWQTWTESQITRAQAEGQFDNLPGAGKPLPDLNETSELAWLAKKLKSEGVDPSVYLPPQLALAREVEDAPSRVATLRTEREVRVYLADLNARVGRLHAQPPAGPPVRAKLVDVDALVEQWCRDRPAPAPAPAPEPVAPRRRWFRRR